MKIKLKKKSNSQSIDNNTASQTTKKYAVSYASLKHAKSKFPLVLLSTTEMETGQLDTPDESEKVQVMACWKFLLKAFPKASSVV